MKSPRLGLLALCFAPLLCRPALAADPDSDFKELDQEDKKTGEAPTVKDFAQKQKEMKELFAASVQRQNEEFEALSAEMRSQYSAMVKKMAQEHERLKNRVLQQWVEFHDSTNKQWVDYNDKGDAMSRIDYEKGQVDIEVLVPVEDVTGGKTKDVKDLSPQEQAKLKELAEAKIAEQTKKVIAEPAEKPAEQKPVEQIPEEQKPAEQPTVKLESLKGQLKAPGGGTVNEKNADQFVEKTLAPKMVVEQKPVLAQDGKPRIKVVVKADLVPDHIKVRAKQFKPLVEASAKKYGLDPAFVYAIIHTESCFNPHARSQAPAFGLMQLMPPTAAREAYKYLYREDKLVTPEYLYDPDNNVLLGATYLHMLETAHFSKVKDPANRRTLSIAAYNCGPGCVRKFVLSKYDVDKMSNDELVEVIKKTVPKETQEYVPHVQGRIALYQDF